MIDKIKKLSKIYNFKIINDNCHAIGSKYLNKLNYAVKYADIVVQRSILLKILQQEKEAQSLLININIIATLVKSVVMELKIEEKNFRGIMK